MSVKKLLYVFTCGPYSSASGQESLDAALMGGAFDQEVSVLFMYDGVFLINANQNTDHSSLKQFTKAFAALQDFGVETALSHQPSMAARGLAPHDLMIDTVAVDSDGVRDLIKQQDRVFIF